MSRVRAAIVGCGGIGSRHAAAYELIDDVEIVAFVDSDIERAKRLATVHGVDAVYTSVPELSAHGVDLVSITTPPMFHTQPVWDALSGGAHVFSEKPITMDIEEGIRLRDLARAKGLHVGVGFKMRFEPIFRQARETIASIGDLLAISAVKIQPYHARPGFDWVPDVGAMYELSVHDYDLIHYIAGVRPQRVSAQLEYAPGWSREKRAFLQVKYESGITGQLMSLYSEDASFLYRDLTLTFVGTRGYMRVERPDRIVVHTDEYRSFAVDPGDGLTPFVDELSSFVRGMNTGRYEPCADIEEAVLTTALVERAVQSNTIGDWVEIAVSFEER